MGPSTGSKLWDGGLPFLVEVLHWIPGLLAAILYWETEPFRAAPFLWNSQWTDSVQSLNLFAVGVSASAWIVLVALRRDGVIRGDSRAIRNCFIAAVILGIPCFVLHSIFVRWADPPALWHGLLEGLWQVCYVAMIVMACLAVSFYLIDLIEAATRVLGWRQAPAGPVTGNLEVSPQGAALTSSSAPGAQEDHAIADLRSRVGQLEGALKDVQERLNQVRQRLGPIEAQAAAATQATHAPANPVALQQEPEESPAPDIER